MKANFTDTYTYNHTSNLKIISLIEKYPRSYADRVASLLCHTLNAQHIWNRRILGIEIEYEVWQTMPLEELGSINELHFQESKQIIDTMDLMAVVNYTNSKGDSFSNSVHHILFHVVNHGTYHRGQIVYELKNQGVPVFGTDYILYKRQR